MGEIDPNDTMEGKNSILQMMCLQTWNIWLICNFKCATSPATFSNFSGHLGRKRAKKFRAETRLDAQRDVIMLPLHKSFPIFFFKVLARPALFCVGNSSSVIQPVDEMLNTVFPWQQQYTSRSNNVVQLW